MINISEKPNPYDFANPVLEQSLFVGRKDELDEIRYYLDHTKKANRAINIAILGQRASGKTSILNMCEFEAKHRGFCTVRIDLNESDAKTQLNFFCKMFDAILTAACEAGAFGGKDSKTYDTYLDIINAYDIPADKTFCPFIFPIQYAKAMSKGNINAQLSDSNFKKDLEHIRSAINHPIILLFDECNVLANNRVLLEMLRNIFMNMPGFMLVFAGTPDLFPVMDDVFSPIVRQFKKIAISGFEKKKETRDCILKPLEYLGISPSEIFDIETYKDVTDIHNFSGGRPYEIQLICHILFRRVQTERVNKMKLSFAALEEARKELETAQDVTMRPILTKIRNTGKEQLKALALLCSCDGHATFEQIWAIEYIFNRNQNVTKENLKNMLEDFLAKDIVKMENNIIKFAGDDFDKIYTKYLVREYDINSSFKEMPLAFFWLYELVKPIQKWGLEPLYATGEKENMFYEVALQMAQKEAEEDVFAEYPAEARTLYCLMINYQEEKTISLISVRLIAPWLNAESWHFSLKCSDSKTNDTYVRGIETLCCNAKEVGVKIEYDEKELSIATVGVLAEKVKRTTNQRLRAKLTNFHTEKVCEEYYENNNAEKATLHAKLAYEYNPCGQLGNNLGYLLMVADNLEGAKNCFETAIKNAGVDDNNALPNYNLGILEAKGGNFRDALERFAICIKLVEKNTIEQKTCDRLIIPKIRNEKLIFEEIQQADLLEEASEAKNILSKLI